MVDYTFKTTPFQHQIDGFNYGMTVDKWLLGDEQGLGKTKQVIDIACAKKKSNGYKHCLIICCVNSLKWNWANEIRKHSNEECHILGQRTKKNNKVYIGSNEDRLEDLQNIDKLPYFIITNIETLRYKVKTGNKVRRRVAGRMRDVDEYAHVITDKLVSLMDNDIGIIAVDEFHKCKNPDSEQGIQIARLRAETQIAMTGTPIMNTPLDLYMTMKWLGYVNKSYYLFKNHYCILGGFGGNEVMGYKNLPELQDKLNTFMLRRLKEDVFDLPEKIFINEYVDMTPKQTKIYNEILLDLKSNVDKIATSSNPLSQLIRLRQATGATNILSSTIDESAKLDRMEELVAEAVSNNRKVVIFSNWTQITDEVTKRLAYYHPSVITGETRDADRQHQVDAFQNDDDVKVIVGTIGAMGTGLTLTAGTVEIFLDEPWTMAMKSQAIDRCHRIGTTSNVTIYTLICKNTIDERINAIVTQKGVMADAIIDNKIVGNRRELLDYLLS